VLCCQLQCLPCKLVQCSQQPATWTMHVQAVHSLPAGCLLAACWLSVWLWLQGTSQLRCSSAAGCCWGEAGSAAVSEGANAGSQKVLPTIAWPQAWLHTAPATESSAPTSTLSKHWAASREQHLTTALAHLGLSMRHGHSLQGQQHQGPAGCIPVLLALLSGCDPRH